VVPVVSVDMLPADVPAEYAPAMVRACNDAVAEGRCAMAAELPESTRPDAIALVLWQGDGYAQVTIRVGRGNGQWVQRALSFAERDSITERFTTVGLTVATLVGETAPASEPVIPSAPAAPTVPQRAVLDSASAAPPSPLPSPAVEAPRRWRFYAALGGLTGPGWLDGGWQRGGFVSFAARWPGTPFVLHAFGSVARSSGPEVEAVPLRSSWLTGGVGAGVTGTWDALALNGVAALEVAARSVHVERNDKSTNASELPVRLRLTGSFPAHGRVGFLVGGLLRVPPSGARSDAQHVRGPALAAELLAGVEVRM
jgi:hypothetical protein